MSHPSRNLLFHPSFSSPLWLINTCNLLTCYLLLLSCFSHVRLCATHSRQPTRLPRPQDSPGKNTGVGCHFLLQCRKVKSESEVAQSCPTLSTPWTAAYQAPPSMGFSRQKYWSGMPLPSPYLLLNGGQELQRDRMMQWIVLHMWASGLSRLVIWGCYKQGNMSQYRSRVSGSPFWGSL